MNTKAQYSLGVVRLRLVARSLIRTLINSRSDEARVLVKQNLKKVRKEITDLKVKSQNKSNSIPKI